jgi:hypothetical protein
MAKKLKKLLVIIVLFFIVLNAAWYYGCQKIVHVVNNNFAGKNFEIGGNIVKFTKATIDGYPNKISLKLENFQESTDSAIITYKQPVKVGFNILTQKVFLSYNGEIITKFKNSNQAIKLEGDYNYYIFYPLTPGLIKTLLTTKDYFELINYIRNIQISFGKAQAFNLTNNQKILDQDYIEATVTPEATVYYKSLQQFLNSIPKIYHLEAKANVSHGTDLNTIPLSLIFIHLPTKILKFQVSSKFNTNADKFVVEDILSDFTLTVSKYNLTYDTFESKGNLELKNYNKSNHLDIGFTSSAETFLKEPLFNTFKRKIELFSPQIRKTKFYEHNAFILKPILDNPEKYIPHLHEFGEMKTKLDLKLNAKDKSSDFKINKFVFDSKPYSLELNNETKMKADLSWTSSGQISIKQYKNFVDLVIGYIQRIALVISNLDKSFIKISDNKFRDSIKVFLRKISNNPKAESDNLYFDFNLSSNSSAARIGSVSVEEAKRIYAGIFAQNLLEDVINSKNPKKEIEKLIPEIKNKPKDLIDKLKQEQKKINPELLKNLLK